jgi:hypothetical protein
MLELRRGNACMTSKTEPRCFRDAAALRRWFARDQTSAKWETTRQRRPKRHTAARSAEVCR